MSTRRKKDPFAKREAEKYQNPIASREFILDYLGRSDVPVSLSDLTKALKIKPQQSEALRRRLKAMERDGQIVRNRRDDYGLPRKMDLIKGRLETHRDGYGFVIPDKGGNDVFLPERQLRSVFHGDRVLVCITAVDRRGRREGALVEVLERHTKEVVGRFFQRRGVGYIEVDDPRIQHDILIPPKEQGEAGHGDMVVAEILEYPGKHNPAVGRISEVLGAHMAPGMEVNIAIRQHNLPHRWSEEVEREIKPLHTQKTLSKKQLKGRADFRALPLVTIDGEDSRDFDDAVYCEPKGKGWRLLVAIADVSTYVKPATALDEAAQERGNSVYFPRRVIPMLPEILSNQWCSLNPEVDRLCMVCELSISMHGGIQRAQFHEGVMRSAARLTYTQVNAFLQGDKNALAKKLHPHLKHLHALYKVLLKRRNKRGAIDFEGRETRILFDDKQKIERIVLYERNDAHRLIEEMMLAANNATAKWLEAREIPFLYRIHNGPSEEKLQQLRTFLGERGLRLHGKDKPQAKHYSALLESIQERPDKPLIQTVLLRSMRQAVYTPENAGHFGLAYESYTHFTSPIRRYPDLLVHRAIRHCLRGGAVEKFPYKHSDMEQLGELCSMTERRADEAVWDVIGKLKCEYMQDKIGQVYTGMVTGVTAFGLFVELEEVFVEGLVHVTSLRRDYYHFDPIHQSLRGERGGKVYHLADKMRVRLVRVDIDEGKIDFEEMPDKTGQI